MAGLNEGYRLARISQHPNAGRAAIAASVDGPLAFNLLGIWATAPRYCADVLASLAAYEDIFRAAPTLVVGDLNSGSSLTTGAATLTRGHAALVDRFASLGLVSAYHAFHGVPHGGEVHASYRHRFAEHDRWHIDFCFLPTSWVPRLTRVEFLDTPAWRAASDHHPLLIELR